MELMEQIIQKDITKETPERILYLIRLGHPDEHNEPYYRGDIIKEITKRGLQILKDLGWETKLTALYKNRYTGDEETFVSLLNKWKPNPRKEGLFHELPYIIENWTPKEFWTDKDCLDEYKLKATLGGWI